MAGTSQTKHGRYANLSFTVYFSIILFHFDFKVLKYLLQFAEGQRSATPEKVVHCLRGYPAIQGTPPLRYALLFESLDDDFPDHKIANFR
jgi:hypothetical protein